MAIDYPFGLLLFKNGAYYHRFIYSFSILFLFFFLLFFLFFVFFYYLFFYWEWYCCFVGVRYFRSLVILIHFNLTSYFIYHKNHKTKNFKCTSPRTKDGGGNSMQQRKKYKTILNIIAFSPNSGKFSLNREL